MQNYVDGWRGAALPFSSFFLNSFIVSGLAVVGNVLACSMVAYAFARLNFIFKRTLFAVMMLTIMLPLHATLISQYALFYNLGWVNTFLPLTVPKFLAVDLFFIFLMIQFIRGIPRELDEAATIDGAGPIRIYWSVILPLLTPALVTTAVFSFIWTYDMLPVTVGVSHFNGSLHGSAGLESPHVIERRIVMGAVAGHVAALARAAVPRVLHLPAPSHRRHCNLGP